MLRYSILPSLTLSGFSRLLLCCLCFWPATGTFAKNDQPATQADRPLIIGGDFAYPPYEFLDQNGKPTGYNVDLSRALAKAIGIKVQIRLASWDHIRQQLENGQIDAIHGMFHSPEREKTVNFTPPHTIVHHAIFKHDNNHDIATINQLANHRIAVMRGDIMHEWLIQQAIPCDLLLFDTQLEALKAVHARQADFALVAKLPGLYWIKKTHMDDLSVTGPLLQPSKYCYAVPKNRPALAARLAEGLAILKATGEYQKIHNRWLAPLEPGTASWWDIAYYALWFIMPLSATTVLFVFWSWSLRRQVKVQTAELQQQIDQHQRTQISLGQTNALLNSVLDNSPDLISLRDANLRFELCNRALSEVLGMTPNRMIGKTDLECGWAPVHSPKFPDTGISAQQKEDERVLEGKVIRNPHNTARIGDRTFIFDTVKVPLLNADQQTRGILTIARDVTQRETTREQLHQAKNLAEAASQAKTDFLANMSHEIRTPMTAILGFSQLLSEHPDDTSIRKQCIESIERNGRHLANIIDDILDLSRIESGKLELDTSPCRLPELIANVRQAMYIQANQKQLELNVTFRTPIPRIVQLQPTYVNQILYNLIANAIKFTDTGSVTLELAAVESDQPDHVQLQMAVIDTGIGINRTEQERLFKSFSQIDASASRRFSGTGLGLAISKRLALAMNGDIQLTSVPGTGSTFCLLLPVAVEDPTPVDRLPQAIDRKTAAAAKTDAVTLRGHILLAEDGPDNQRLICHLLKRLGLTVDPVTDGQQAVDRIRTNPNRFDLILMDIQMPNLDGYQATKAVRKLGYRRPIIALTAHAMNSERQRCLAAGCDEHMSKPINFQKLTETLQQYLN